MGNPNIQERLYDFLDAIHGARQAVNGKSYEVYFKDWTTRRAVERALEIISEASRHIPNEIKAQKTDTNWRHVADIGNILRHEYHNVSHQVIYNIVRDDLPALEVFIAHHYKNARQDKR